MAVSLILDAVVALVCLIIVVRNAVRGFIKSLVLLMKSVLAVFLAYLFNAPLARGMSQWWFSDLSRGWVQKLMLSTEKEGGYALFEIFDGIPEWFTKVTVTQGIEQEKVEYYFVQENLATKEVVDELSLPLGDALSMLISTVLAFIALFIVIEIILACVGALLNRLGKLPGLKTINALLGAFVGAIIAAIAAWLISTAIIYVFNFGSNYYPEVFTDEIIEKTMIVKFFGEHNLFTIAKGFFVK